MFSEFLINQAQHIIESKCIFGMEYFNLIKDAVSRLSFCLPLRMPSHRTFAPYFSSNSITVSGSEFPVCDGRSFLWIVICQIAIELSQLYGIECDQI